MREEREGVRRAAAAEHKGMRKSDGCRMRRAVLELYDRMGI